MFVIGNLLEALAAVINVVLNLLLLVIFVNALLSMKPMLKFSPRWPIRHSCKSTRAIQNLIAIRRSPLLAHIRIGTTPLGHS